MFTPDLAVILSLRLWQAAAGLITTLLAVHFLSAEEQGWYYSFISVAALYTLFDLGLSSVLVQVSAHGFSAACWNAQGRIEGDNRDYCQALIGRATYWYALMAVVFWVSMLPGGYLFFSAQQGSTVAWHGQWLVLCTCTALGLLAIPLLAVLEGSGQLTSVYSVRLIQAVCGSLLCWGAFVLKAGLWATIMVPAMSVLIPGTWLLLRRPSLISTAIRHRRADFAWGREIWPLQWRLGMNWLCGYLLTQINIPVLFHMKGPVVAGKLGLSLAIVNTIGLVAQSWLIRRVPVMANAVATRDWQTLDRTFRRNYAFSMFVFIVSATLVLLFAATFRHLHFVQRLLDLPDLAGLLAFMLASQLIGGLTLQLRSFKREPFIRLVIGSTLVAVPAMLFATRLYSVSGMIAVLDVIYLGFNLPLAWLLWRRYNRQWRQELQHGAVA